MSIRVQDQLGKDSKICTERTGVGVGEKVRKEEKGRQGRGIQRGGKGRWSNY